MSKTPIKKQTSFSELPIETTISASPTNTNGSSPFSILKKILSSQSDISNLSNLTTSSDSDSITEEVREDCEKFLFDCGNDYADEKRYGSLETRGIILNLETNQYLKVSGTENTNANKSVSDATAFTQEAFYVEVDKTALKAHGTKVDKDVINTLPEQEGTLSRVKDIKYGNLNALWEIIAGQLYGLTGLNAPDTRLLIHSKYGTRHNGAPKVFVASPTVTGYQDIGDFLINPVMERFIAEEHVEKWKNNKAGIEKINNLSRNNKPITDIDKLERLQLMGEICKFLPEYFFNEMEKAFVASQFVANWDFANLNLNNIGCKFTLDDQGNVIGFESVFVDFGNSGKNGFGGEDKDHSFARANREAKAKKAKYEKNEKIDYDPSLTFGRTEWQLIEKKIAEIPEDELSSPLTSLNFAQENLTKAINALAKELADEEAAIEKKLSHEQVNRRRSIIAKAVHKIRPTESSMEIDPRTVGPLTLSSVPRNIPIGVLLTRAIEAKTKFLASIPVESRVEIILSALNGDGIDTNHLHQQSAFYRDSEIEMAFRLSLIPDAAIESVVKKWNLQETYPHVFAPEKSVTHHDSVSYSSEDVVRIFKERRDTLIKAVPEKVVNEWIAKNRAIALSAEQDVTLALLKKTNLPIQEDFSFTQRLTSAVLAGIAPSGNDLSAEKIKHQIIQQEKNTNSSSDYLNTLANYEKRQSSLERIIQNCPAEDRETLEESFNDLVVKIDKFKTVKTQKDCESTVKFIENGTNIAEWKESLGIAQRPNCSLLNLNKFREIYQAQNHVVNLKTNDDFIVDDEANLRRNKNLHDENCFVLKGFKEILDQLSPLRQDLALTSPRKSSAQKLAEKTIYLKEV